MLTQRGRHAPDTLYNTFLFGAVIVEVHNGWTVTRIPGFPDIVGRWDEQPGQAETAKTLGVDVRKMNADHDLLHSAFAHMTGLDASMALLAAAGAPVNPDVAAAEEAAVLALQKFLYAYGLNVFEFAAHVRSPANV